MLYLREASSLLDSSKNSRHRKGIEGEVDKTTEDHAELGGVLTKFEEMRMRLGVEEMKGVRFACNTKKKMM